MSAPSPTLATASPPSPHTPRRFLSLDNRYLAPLLITVILLVGQIGYGFLESYRMTLLAIASAIGLELILGRLTLGKWPNLSSAYISGISVGILVRSPFAWPFAVASMISITSKYVLRWRARHLWNPSNFGLSAIFFLAPGHVASLGPQWGNAIGPMVVIWCLGSLIIWRLRRFHICATYVASFLIFSAIRATWTGNSWEAEVAPITGPMYQLFIFFMITDPRTTVRTRWGQCVVAFLVAFAEMVIRLKYQDVHAPYYALFVVGPAANALEIWWDSRQAAKAKAAAQPEL